MKKSYVYGVVVGLLVFSVFMFGLEKNFTNYKYALIISFVFAAVIGYCIAFVEMFRDMWCLMMDGNWWEKIAVGASHFVAFLILCLAILINSNMMLQDKDMLLLRTMIGVESNISNGVPFVFIASIVFWMMLYYMIIRLLKTDYLYNKHNPWEEAKYKPEIKDPIDDYTSNEYLWRIVATLFSAVIVSFFTIPLMYMFLILLVLVVAGLVLSLVIMVLPDAPKHFKPLSFICFFVGGLIAIFVNDYSHGNNLLTFMSVGIGAWIGFFIAQTAVILGRLAVIKKSSVYLAEKFS